MKAFWQGLAGGYVAHVIETPVSCPLLTLQFQWSHVSNLSVKFPLFKIFFIWAFISTASQRNLILGLNCASEWCFVKCGIASDDDHMVSETLEQLNVLSVYGKYFYNMWPEGVYQQLYWGVRVLSSTCRLCWFELCFWCGYLSNFSAFLHVFVAVADILWLADSSLYWGDRHTWIGPLHIILGLLRFPLQFTSLPLPTVM